ncbi:MAG: DUF427 domain-containing protein [Chloroflexi bacterium]|nr:DUF427 domain-containing protein [Chloroflexota bacterium]
MARAIWNGKVIAESDKPLIVEGNLYFPRDTVRAEFLRESESRTICPWKGEASYFHLAVDGAENHDAAWCYPEPKKAAQQIKDHVAFWRGVSIER